MNYSFIIRRASEEDIPAIKEITLEAFHKYVEDAGLTGTIAALEETNEDILNDIKTKEVYVAFIDNIPVGSIRFEIRSDSTAYISRFGVRLDYHNIGIGKSLMNMVDKVLCARGVKKAYLHTASKYTVLVRFYYGRGFYVDSTTTDRGYIRALMCKEYFEDRKSTGNCNPKIKSFRSK